MIIHLLYEHGPGDDCVVIGVYTTAEKARAAWDQYALEQTAPYIGFSLDTRELDMPAVSL